MKNGKQTTFSIRTIQLLIAAYRRLPFRPFRKTLISSFAKFKQANSSGTVIATIGGVTYELDLNEMIDSAIYYEGCYEPYATAIIDRFVRPGMTVFDIGANVGCHTLRMAKLVGPRGRVVAFEPTSWAWFKLMRNVELNHFDDDRVTLEKVALSNTCLKQQTISFQSSWSLSPSNSNAKTNNVVDFTTLDEHVMTKNIEKLDFIKLDVDGFEYKVVQGGLRTLRSLKPTILMEFAVSWLGAVGDNAADLIAVLSSLGYVFYSERGLKRFPSNDAVVRIAEKSSAINILVTTQEL